jgi:hypothetical protein
MQGSYIDTVSVTFPFVPTPELQVSLYNSTTQQIYLSEDDGTQWDIILHEYAHHIQNQLGIDSSYGGGDHSMVVDLMTYGNFNYSKMKATHLAWSEAVATIFSELCQTHSATSISGIYHIADKKYEDYFNYETAKYTDTNENYLLSLMKNEEELDGIEVCRYNCYNAGHWNSF